jgi:hypothetical protein
MTMIYQDLSFEQRLHNAIGAQEIEQVKAWHAYTHGMGYSKEEWDAIWYRGEDVTWAHFFGRMVGWDEVWYGSVVNPEEGYYERYCNHILNYKGASYFDARSVGCTALHCLASGVIEVAEDGMSGRSCYLTPGTMMARMSPNKQRNGGFLWERYGSDFAYDTQDGKWYYFHEHVCPDIGSEYGTSNWAQNMYDQEVTGRMPFGPPPEDDKKEGAGPGGPGGPEGEGPGGPGGGPDGGPDGGGHGGAPGGYRPVKPRGAMGGPPCTDPGPLHNNAAMTQTVQNTVPWPEPYKTLDDQNSYAPGHNDITKRYSALKSIVKDGVRL